MRNNEEDLQFAASRRKTELQNDKKKRLNIPKKKGEIGVDEIFPSKGNYDPKLVLLIMMGFFCCMIEYC